MVRSRALPLLLLIVVFQARIVSAQQVTAIIGATLINGTGADPVSDAAIVIQGNRIAAVGPRSRVSIPPGASVVDAAGKFITPGIIDNNIHLILFIVPEFYIKYEDRLEEVVIQSAQIALKYGVTTVRDSWGPLESLLRARDRINRGERLGARMLVAGNIVGTGGPFSTFFLGERGAWVSPLVQKRINALWEENVGPTLLGMRPEEVRREIRKYLMRGVDFVKVAASAHGLGVQGNEPLMFSPEVLRVMAEEVHGAGKIFETHTATPESLRLAVESGADLLQHPEVLGEEEIADEMIALIKSRNIFCAILTRFSFPKKMEQERSKFPNWYGKGDVDFYESRQFQHRVKNVRKMIAAGVRLAMATDMGPQSWELAYRPMSPMIGVMHFETMEDYQAAGATPMQVIVASTKTGAEACKLEKDLGTLEAGKIADLLVLHANPLETISNMRKIDRVMKDGKFIDRAKLPENPILKFDPEGHFEEAVRKPTNDRR